MSFCENKIKVGTWVALIPPCKALAVLVTWPEPKHRRANEGDKVQEAQEGRPSLRKFGETLYSKDSGVAVSWNKARQLVEEQPAEKHRHSETDGPQGEEFS